MYYYGLGSFDQVDAIAKFQDLSIPEILDRFHHIITRKQSARVMAQFKVATLAGSLNVTTLDCV